MAQKKNVGCKQNRNIRKAYDTSRRYMKELKDNTIADKQTGEHRTPTEKQVAYRQGYVKAVTTLGNGVMYDASNGVIKDGKLPEGKGVCHTLFDLPNASK